MTAEREQLIGQEDWDHEQRIHQRGRNSPGETLRDLTKAFAKVPPSIKILKIGEEYGEASSALIGLNGHNPRKGFYASESDVAKELADVAITALVALSEYAEDPWGTFLARLHHVTERALVPQ